MYRTTITVMTLAFAVALAATVSTGSLAATGVDDATSVASTPSPTSPVSTAETSVPQHGAQVDTEPAPQPTQLDEALGEVTEAAVPESSTTTQATTTVAAAPARPQSTTPAAPFAAQPAPFGSASPSPSAPACATAITGSTPGAPSRTSPLGVAGTTSDDLQSFAVAYNAIRVANCLQPVPFANIRYDSCMEDRLFWMAEDPSTDPMSAWGHIGSQRSDGLPSVGCDGNLAGGHNNGGATVAQKWWDSTGHRTSLYKPTLTGSTASVCILFAMTHGGVPDEPYSFTRSAARWVDC